MQQRTSFSPSILEHSTFVNRKKLPDQKPYRRQSTFYLYLCGRPFSLNAKRGSARYFPVEGAIDLTTIEEESGEVLDTLFIDIPSERKEINLVRSVQEKQDYKSIWNIYAAPIAGFGHVDTEQKQVGFGYTSAGGFLGFDVTLPRNPDLSRAEGGVGAIIEYREQWGDAEHHAGSFSSEKLHTSVYGTLIPTAHSNLFFRLDWRLCLYLG